MFVSTSKSFHLIASFSFELILMPEMPLEEGYVMNLSDLFQQMAFCHFCHDLCGHAMILSSTCVLLYAMPSLQRCLPCIFLIFVATSTSLRSSVIGNADFRDLEFLQVLVLILSLCHMFMLFTSDPCLF